MTVRASRVWQAARAEVERLVAVSPSMRTAVADGGGVDREADFYAAVDVDTAVRAIALGRYRHRRYESERRRQAVEDVRLAIECVREEAYALVEALRRLGYIDREGG